MAGFNQTSADIEITIKKNDGTYSQRKTKKKRILRGVRANITADEAAAIAGAFGRLMALPDETYIEPPVLYRGYKIQ